MTMASLLAHTRVYFAVCTVGMLDSPKKEVVIPWLQGRSIQTSTKDEW